MRTIRACAVGAALTSGVVVASVIPAAAEDGPALDAGASASVDVGPITADLSISAIIEGLVDVQASAGGSVG